MEKNLKSKQKVNNDSMHKIAISEDSKYKPILDKLIKNTRFILDNPTIANEYCMFFTAYFLYTPIKELDNQTIKDMYCKARGKPPLECFLEIYEAFIKFRKEGKLPEGFSGRPE